MKNKKILSKNNILLVCILSPIVFSLLRKALPGQPSMLDVVPSIIIFIFFLLTFRSKVKLPKNMKAILTVLIYTYLFFIVLSIPYDFRVGLTSFFTRVSPILLVIIFYKLIHNFEQITKLGKYLGWLSIALLPVGLVGSVYGNISLPTLLSPVDVIITNSRDLRNGISSISTVFNTQFIMSWSMVGIIAFIGYALTISNKNRLFYYVSLLSSIILLYLTVRRGALVVGVICLIFIFVKKINFKSIIVSAIAISVLLISLNTLDDFSGNFSDQELTRSEQSFNTSDFRLDHRLGGIFWTFFSFWSNENPFGSFLGYAGPEGAALGYNLVFEKNMPVEVGGAQLIAETGILGCFIITTMIILLICNQYYASRKTPYHKAILILISFQTGIFVMYFLKELLALTNPSIGQYVFWASFGMSMATIRIHKNRRIQ